MNSFSSAPQQNAMMSLDKSRRPIRSKRFCTHDTDAGSHNTHAVAEQREPDPFEQTVHSPRAERCQEVLHPTECARCSAEVLRIAVRKRLPNSCRWNVGS